MWTALKQKANDLETFSREPKKLIYYLLILAQNTLVVEKQFKDIIKWFNDQLIISY